MHFVNGWNPINVYLSMQAIGIVLKITLRPLPGVDKLQDCVAQPRGQRGVLNFHFGIDLRPFGPQRGA